MKDNFRNTCLKNIINSQSENCCLIIGEVSQTHDGSLGQAHAFIDAIANAGADAIKFQTHIAAAESSLAEPWRVKFSPQDETRFAYWQRMEFTTEQWANLKLHAEDRGLLFLSTPFSNQAVDLLDEIGMKVWKIASGEVGNTQLLNRITQTRNPIILSSGMSDWNELDAAVRQIKNAGNLLAVLQCTTSYPCPPEKIGLNMLQVLRERYDCPTGLSDHSGNIFASLAAVTLGAEILEVHVTLSREMFGPDVPASVTTIELRQLIEGTRLIEKMMANPIDKEKLAAELAPLRQIFTKSIFAGEFLQKGTIISSEHLQIKKPGTGIPASSLPQIIGQRLRRDLSEDEMLTLNDIEIVNEYQSAKSY